MTAAMLMLILLGHPHELAPSQPRSSPGDEAEPPTEPPTDERPGAGSRIVAAMGIAGIGVGVTTVAGHFAVRCRSGPSGLSIECATAAIAIAALGAGAIVAGAWGGHRLFGGRSNLGWAVLGLAIGGSVGVLAGYIIGTTFSGSTAGAPAWAPVLLIAGCAGVGAALMVEAGHRLVMNEERGNGRPPVGLAPLLFRDGAGLALAGEL